MEEILRKVAPASTSMTFVRLCVFEGSRIDRPRPGYTCHCFRHHAARTQSKDWWRHFVSLSHFSAASCHWHLGARRVIIGPSLGPKLCAGADTNAANGRTHNQDAWGMGG